MQDGTNKTKTLLGALMDFFGKKPGQTLQDFSAEMKTLTDADRAYFKAELEKVGYQITPSKAA